MIVIALGGSVIFNNMEEFGKVLRKYNKIAVVVGGGKVAREYIELARKLGANEAFCDTIGIEVTRINAKILALALNAPPIIPKDFDEAYKLLCDHDRIVMGGTFPGHTTDATAALLAEYLNADKLLIATSVDYVYSEDPRVNPNAKKFEELSYEKLVEIVSKNEAKAGGSSVVDILAAKIIQRSKIETIVFRGTPENLEKALNGERVGTIIR